MKIKSALLSNDCFGFPNRGVLPLGATTHLQP